MQPQPVSPSWDFSEIWRQDLSFAFPIMVTMCALRQVFWVADVSEMAQVRGSWENCLHAWTAKCPGSKNTKRFPLLFSLLIKIHKMALKRKIIVLPTHDDIMSYRHIHCPIPVSGRSTAMHTAHLNRGHGQVESRKADRNRAVLRL